jgi:hypothetical protein
MFMSKGERLMTFHITVETDYASRLGWVAKVEDEDIVGDGTSMTKALRDLVKKLEAPSPSIIVNCNCSSCRARKAQR